MPGGLLNIISEGNNNVILTGTPTKTFFKVAYSKYTNFGLQKFRIDYEGNRDLRTTEPSTFKFKIKRYAELLMDTYLVITLPDIWSPIYHPTEETNNKWSAYEFKWIRDIGTHIIKELSVNCGSMLLQKYSGEYLHAMVERDFSKEKKELFDRMSGNVRELYEPSYTNGRVNTYPNAFYTSNNAGAEPSIRGRLLYIPINLWFTLDSRCAFPLISLQYNELEISVTLRPIQELFQVRDVFDPINNYPYIQPDFNQFQFQMHRFLQTPPAVILDNTAYENKTNIWNCDIHLISTYCFLSNEESALFASQEQVYLVKDVFEYTFENVTGSDRVSLTSNGMVSSWMWFFQRNDVNLRNEWSNYTNYPYTKMPVDITLAPKDLPQNGINVGSLVAGPFFQPDGTNTGYFFTGDYAIDNEKDILQTMAIVLNGEYRENTFDSGIYNYIEKYTRTKGNAKDGLYCYNFCLNTSPFEYQPSGAINMSKFKTIELEFTTYIPQIDPSNSFFNIICNDSGGIIGVTKQNWRLYEYNYNLMVFEERYNIISFIGGNCGLYLAR